MIIIQKRSQAFYIFALFAFFLMTVCLMVGQSELFLRNPTVVASAIAFDLTVTVGTLYYFLLVRTGYASVLTIVLVLMAGLHLTHLLLPVNAQSILRPLTFLAAPLELFSIGWLIYRVRRNFAQRKTVDGQNVLSNPLQRFEDGIRALYKDGILVDLVMAEVSVFYFAFLARYFRQPVPEGALAVTGYKKCGWGTMVALISFLILLEGAVLHFVLQQWSGVAAWIVSAFDLYALVLVFADYQALRLCPSLLRNDSLYIQFGLRWKGNIPVSCIRTVVPFSWKAAPPESSSYLKLCLGSDPDFIISLRESVEFRGPLGMKRNVRRVGIQIDDPNVASRLMELVEQPVPSSEISL